MQHKKEEDRTRVSSGEGFFPAKYGKQSRVSGKALTEEEDLLEAQGEMVIGSVGSQGLESLAMANNERYEGKLWPKSRVA